MTFLQNLNIPMKRKHAAEKGNKKQQVKPEAREFTLKARDTAINSWS